MLGTLFYRQKITSEVWDTDTGNFGLKVAVLNAQNHRWGLEQIETSNSGTNYAVLCAQNDR